MQEWLANLVACAREWRRVLRDDGTLWINCGDAYASSSLSPRPSNPGLTGDHNLNPERNPPSPGFKPKDLMGLPHRLAFALQADGWYLRSAIVWVKGIDWTDAEREAQEQIREALALVRAQAEGSLWGLDKGLERAIVKAERAVDRLVMSGAAMPESVTDRPTSAYEMLSLFSKSSQYYYDREAVKVPNSLTTGRWGKFPGTATADAQSETCGEHGATSGLTSKMSKEEYSAKYYENGRNARNAWRIPVENSPSGGYQLPDGRAISHFASFPQALAARAILAATSEAGCCATCAAPWKRVTSRVFIPQPDVANSPALFKSPDGLDESSGWDGAPRGTVQVNTLAWTPTCRCHGDPLPADVPCPKCNGTGKDMDTRAGATATAYDEKMTAGRLALLRQTAREAGAEYGAGFLGIETSTPCPACLCPDCAGTGKEHVYPRGSEPYKAQVLPGRSPHSLNTDHDGRDFAKPQPTAAPCPTCNGLGATGRVNGETWPDDVLERWPRKPCVVLDPMAGTGQTGRAALDLGRSVILNDLSPDYTALMHARLDAWPDDLRGPVKTSTADDEPPSPLLPMQL